MFLQGFNISDLFILNLFSYLLLTGVRNISNKFLWAGGPLEGNFPIPPFQ